MSSGWVGCRVRRGLFRTFWGPEAPYSALLWRCPLLLTTFSTSRDRVVTQGAIKGNTYMQKRSDCWKTCLWLPAKATSLLKGLFSYKVSSHHVMSGPSKVVSAEAMAKVGFLFGGAEPQLAGLLLTGWKSKLFLKKIGCSIRKCWELIKHLQKSKGFHQDGFLTGRYIFTETVDRGKRNNFSHKIHLFEHLTKILMFSELWLSPVSYRETN